MRKSLLAEQSHLSASPRPQSSQAGLCRTWMMGQAHLWARALSSFGQHLHRGVPLAARLPVPIERSGCHWSAAGGSASADRMRAYIGGSAACGPAAPQRGPWRVRLNECDGIRDSKAARRLARAWLLAALRSGRLVAFGASRVQRRQRRTWSWRQRPSYRTRI